jgi:hypothetical protein
MRRVFVRAGLKPASSVPTILSTVWPDGLVYYEERLEPVNAAGERVILPVHHRLLPDYQI